MTADTVQIPEMIAAQAAAQPNAVAVAAGTHTLTYGQLSHAAARIAHRLRAAGIGRGQVVGLTGPRSAQGVVGMLGTLTAGAAYAYLDPAWPAERLRHVVGQCRIRSAVATDYSVGGHLRAHGLDVVTIGVDDPLPDGWCHPQPPPVSRPDDLCYVVYTSGSTGVPKGVAVEHRGVANMATQLAKLFDVRPGMRMLQFASWAWDAAACEILVTLTAGATLVLAPDTVRHGGQDLATFLRQQRVNVATLTPSLLAALPADQLPDLHTMVAVGETCPADLVDRWAVNGRRFLNGYGPTEATVAVSVGQCRPGEPVTIGPPLPGVTIRIVDDADTPVTLGQPGELLVGGLGLARGYLTDPAEADSDVSVISGGRFLIDPAGMRWYRTGDVVCERPEGTLVFLGRRDEQVQIHGHRVELGEVAHAIRRHSNVRACAIIARAGRLVAFVHTDDPALTPADLSSAAALLLPPHMLPEIHLVDQWPVNARGKTDLAALTRTARGVRPAEPAKSPASPPDRAVADALTLVRRILDDDTVGPDVDFFDAGGHSLLAAQLAVEIGQRFGVVVDARQVTERRTARQLADLITQPAYAGPRR